jgi:putative SOS response-associated peptidase YedK
VCLKNGKMCGRMAFEFDSKMAKRLFKVDRVMNDFKPNYNAAPSQMIPVITAGSRVLDTYKWGLIPRWAKDEKFGSKLINARAETLEDKPSFRDAFHKFRCLILVSGFFEWKNRVPHYIKLKGKEIYALGGIASIWKSRDKKKESIATCCVITTKANKFMEEIHHRMPVIIKEEDYDAWIDPNTELDRVERMLKPYNSRGMEEFVVSSEVNKVKNNSKDLLEPREVQTNLN